MSLLWGGNQWKGRAAIIMRSLERLYHLAVVSGAHFTLGTILIVILVPSGSAKSRVPPVHLGWLSRQLEGDGLED